MNAKRRVAVLISGNGSNLQALIDHCAMPGSAAEIVLVLSNKQQAYGLKRAENAGITTYILPHDDYDSRDAYDAALDEALTKHQIEIVCLAGFMRLLTPAFTERWQGRMLNIHPSLLPAFKGLHTHGQALAAGVRIAGCSVHFVSAEMDAGALILQAAVPVLPADDEATLAARVLAREHEIYPLALDWLARGNISLQEGRVIYAPGLEDAIKKAAFN